jgi:MSHA pilin protein MshC
MLSNSSQHGASGFTVVELVVTIGIVALLGAIAIPRFMGASGFQSRGFYDSAKSVVRFAQKTAIAWRKEVFVCVTATRVSAGTAAGCATPIINPVTGGALDTGDAPSGVTLTAAAFSFDSAGRPNPNAAVTITLTSAIPDDPVRLIVVERETGYVHP